MKLQLLPSTFEPDGRRSPRQHLTTLVVDDLVAFDAGGLAMATNEKQKANIRDVVLSHAHLDHVAGLPLFIDDLFATLTEPVRIHASASVIEILEEHIFNWSIYPRFSELKNEFGPVQEYFPFVPGEYFDVRGYSVLPIEVNHRVPSCGFVISDGRTVIATTGDTAPTDVFWRRINAHKSLLNVVLIECAFPDDLSELAAISHHLTPTGLKAELRKLERTDCRVYVVNIKPAYRERTLKQIRDLGIERVQILEVGREYVW